MKRCLALAGLAASIGLAAGCPPAAVGPPPLRFGQEACARCRMIISDARFAAALATESGDASKFDDVGCMVEHEAGGFRASTAYWVRDFRADAWIDARQATFVRSRTVASPMGFDLAGVRTPPAAGEFGEDSQARTFRLEDLTGLLASGRHDNPNDPRP
ncbi:MAG: nitrous oxide reductase accessory protein NosL [Isosphaeraceae bacterium]